MRSRAAAAVVLCWLALPPAAVSQQETGAAAFARGDYAAAEAAWREEAAEGSAEARLGLGRLADLGLGVPRDPEAALGWYLEAARAGLAEAQFNAAVMLDAGTVGPRDLAAAAGWYGRAAAQGHRRAQYNLALLHAAGDGVPRNLDLARLWFDRAAEALPAARDRLADLDPVAPGARMLDAPEVLAGAVVARDGAPHLELAWTAPPGPPGAPFLVEVARGPGGDGAPGEVLLSEETGASALAAPLPPGAPEPLWRVARLDRDAGRYAASPWLRLAGPDGAGEGVAGPPGRVVLRTREGDASAGRLARELGADLEGAGLGVRIETLAEAPPASVVRYAFEDDAALAAAVAAFLPVLSPEDAERVPDDGAAPGEVVAWLVGGPSADLPTEVTERR